MICACRQAAELPTHELGIECPDLEVRVAWGLIPVKLKLPGRLFYGSFCRQHHLSSNVLRNANSNELLKGALVWHLAALRGCMPW